MTGAAQVSTIDVVTERGRFATMSAAPLTTVRGWVLLIPGFTGSKEDFEPILPLLAAAGWQALAYDQRGQYQTPGGYAASYTLEALASDALSIADAVAPTKGRHLVGHSFGGLVAQAAALQAPQTWQSVMLVCSGPGGFRTRPEANSLRSFAELVGVAPLEAVYEARLSDDRRRGRRAPAPEAAAFQRARFSANAPECLRAMAQLLIDAPDRVVEVAALGLPVAVVRGADDDAWSHAVQGEMAARLGTSVGVVPDSAHSPAVENPPEMARRLITFLTATEESALALDERAYRVRDQLDSDR
ncbi:MAG: alpha/beta fold hydrolase [Nocardioidaceae bacterium]